MMERNCFAITALLVVALYGVQGDSEWMKGDGNSCYKFVQHSSTAKNADVECALMGGHLAWLETAAEQVKFEQLRHKFGSLNQSYRLGGVKDYYGRWFWANSLEPNCMAPVTVTDWHSGQPDGECMVYETRGELVAWRATTCDVPVYFACEKYCQ